MGSEKIYNKPCFVRKNGKLYCSKCRKPITPDRYNMHEHARRCGFGPYGLIEKEYRENQDFVSAWKRRNDELILVVFTPKLEYGKTSIWHPVYRCAFKIGQKSIREIDGGLQGLSFWQFQNMETLNVDSVFDIMNRHFHIPGYRSLCHFINIYKGKGYCYREAISDKRAKEILQMPISRGEPPENLTELPDNPLGRAVVALFEGSNEKEPILRVDLYCGARKEPYQMLFARDYFYTEDEFDTGKLLKLHIVCQIEEHDLEKFHECYPEIGLMNYWESSHQNILIPLLSAYYDPQLELLSKSGCGMLADNYYTHKAFQDARTQATGNLKQTFHIPPKILRKIKRDCLMNDEFLNIIAEAYQKAPEYLACDVINYSLVEYLKDNVLAHLNNTATSINDYANYDKKIKLRIARYLANGGHLCGLDTGGYTTYIDYLNMSRENEQLFLGYTPENLRYAHRRVLEHHCQKYNQEMLENFELRVTSEDYIKYESAYGNESVLFENDDYFIRAPRSGDEMIWESKEMHHCVRTYIPQVKSGLTRVYFLRHKERPEVSLATIEVYNNRVNQLKMKYNRRAPESIQAFVKRWAQVKGLRTDSADFDLSKG